MGNFDFSSDKELSQRAAKEQLKFIDSQFSSFKSKASLKDLGAFKQFWNMLNKNIDFTDKQLSYIDVMYEKTMRGLGFPSFNRTYKPNKMRY